MYRIRKIISQIQEDIKSYNKYNICEKKVIKSNYFSSYKGLFVIRTNLRRSGSYYILFISKNMNKSNNPEDVVRHEYGHYLQLKKMGIIRYTLFIGIPSLLNWGKGRYYEKPWEITADILGGVISRKHSNRYITRGNDYLKKWS